MKISRSLPVIIVLVLISAILFSCGTKDRTDNQKKVRIVTTLFPLYDFTRSITEGRADILLMLPPGVEAHAHEPKPADILKIDRADVFVYTGKYMEPWAQDILKAAANKRLVVVNTSYGIKLLQFEEGGGHSGSIPGHDHEVYDPHIWLDFENAMKMVNSITDGLCTADSGNCDYYRGNADRYKNKLAGLDKEFKEGLSRCKKKTLIHGGHFAFGYLARRYGLEYVSAYGGSPNAEPTAKKIIALKRKLRQNDIHWVFFEELLNPRVAQIISNETGAGLLKLNGAHNINRDEFEKEVTFLSLMKGNLDNLKIGLECN